MKFSGSSRLAIPKLKNELNISVLKSGKKRKRSPRTKKRNQKGTGYIGMEPLDGYKEIEKEEVRRLKRMTDEEARIQTEILLRATRWMK